LAEKWPAPYRIISDLRARPLTKAVWPSYTPFVTAPDKLPLIVSDAPGCSTQNHSQDFNPWASWCLPIRSVGRVADQNDHAGRLLLIKTGWLFSTLAGESEMSESLK